MRFFVKSGGSSSSSYVIPCNNPSAAVETLKTAIVERVHGKSALCDNFKLSLSGNEAVLSEKDIISEVLRDGTSVCGEEPEPSRVDLSVLPRYSSTLCQSLTTNIREAPFVELDGNTLTIDTLLKIGHGRYRVKLSDSAVECIKKSRSVVDEFVSKYQVIYGITTGFGKFARVVIPEQDLSELQVRLVRSHAAGVGEPLSPHQVRCMLTLRINVLAKGFSGIRLETVELLVSALNKSCLPFVPTKGTVGASGDLAPLSHLALGMMGEGLMWSPSSGWGQASDILLAHDLHPVKLSPKEGLSLINGTQFITSIGAEAVWRAALVAKQADIIAALTIDVLQGTPRAFDHDIHASRPHPGQQKVAATLRAVLDSAVHPSQIREGHKDCGRVQDPYTMRCVPQVHGIVYDTIEFVEKVITTEMNSVQDNPMVLADRKETISGGNFHGEYPAKVLDYLAIGVHELANISERRQERLMNPAYSNLPAFLVSDGGINSGFMIAHCTSAALVSENKVLTHPASVDSISTSAGTEDHVSMGGFSARKALEVVKHVEQVLAIELLAACQALEFHRPAKTTPPLESVYSLVRSVVKPWDKDRYMASDILAATKLIIEGKVWSAVDPHIQHYKSSSSN